MKEKQKREKKKILLLTFGHLIKNDDKNNLFNSNDIK